MRHPLEAGLVVLALIAVALSSMYLYKSATAYAGADNQLRATASALASQLDRRSSHFSAGRVSAREAPFRYAAYMSRLLNGFLPRLDDKEQFAFICVRYPEAMRDLGCDPASHAVQWGDEPTVAIWPPWDGKRRSASSTFRVHMMPLKVPAPLARERVSAVLEVVQQVSM